MLRVGLYVRVSVFRFIKWQREGEVVTLKEDSGVSLIPVGFSRMVRLVHWGPFRTSCANCKIMCVCCFRSPNLFFHGGDMFFLCVRWRIIRVPIRVHFFVRYQLCSRWGINFGK